MFNDYVSLNGPEWRNIHSNKERDGDRPSLRREGISERMTGDVEGERGGRKE